MTVLEIVQNLLSEVNEASNFARRIIEVSPKGTLKTRFHNGKVRYFQREESETEGKYLGREAIETIKSLEEKDYYSDLLRIASKEKKDLEKIESILKEMPDYKSVFLNIPPEKRHLIAPYEVAVESPEEVFRIFNKKKVDERIKLITQNGEHVRSKSELIIADRLKNAGVPYYYEDPLILTDKDLTQECLYWHPDFKVQNVKTGKQYYWEHFGLLDNSDYCESCQTKLETYAHYGFFPGENLIITSESSTHSLNLEYVDCLIEKYLK